jgi:hypothetical protein
MGLNISPYKPNTHSREGPLATVPANYSTIALSSDLSLFVPRAGLVVARLSPLHPRCSGMQRERHSGCSLFGKGGLRDSASGAEVQHRSLPSVDCSSPMHGSTADVK